MASLNKVFVIGNLGGDPDIRSFQNGGKVANFSVATTRKWKTREGEIREETEWHRVNVTSDGLVGVVERFLKKGSRVHVEGRLKTRKWTDQNGVERYTTEIIVGGHDGGLLLLGDPRGGGEAGGNRSGHYSDAGAGAPSDAGIDDEIPF